MHSFYLDAIRNFEGFTPQAKWDYAQLSNGFGTRARYAGEVIDRVEADRRFQAEVSSARSIVDKAAPNVDEGTKAALTSLTYNSGTAWIQSGLGDAVRRGDLDTARDIFQQYNKAGGEVLPGLVNRRTQEALWIGNPDAVSMASASGDATAGSASTSTLPPVVQERDQGALKVAEILQQRAARSAAAASRDTTARFEAISQTARPAISDHATKLANDALAAMVGVDLDRLAGGGLSDYVRLAQLGRGSELANGGKGRQDADKETRRI